MGAQTSAVENPALGPKPSLTELIAKGQVDIPVCKLSTFANLEPRPASSASNTLIVFGDVKINQRLYPVVLKAFITDPNDTSLKAEAKIYIKYIRKLVARKISPCFIVPVAFAQCHDFLEQIEKLDIEDKYLKILEQGFLRIIRNIRRRGSLQTARTTAQVQVNLLVLEKAIGATTMNSWLSSPQFSEQRFLILLVQILYTLAVMQHYKIIHNDLHLGNIFVVDLPKKTKMLFALGKTCNEMFLMETSRIAKIYDWDRGVAPEIPNSKLFFSSSMCINYGECDVPNYKRDLYLLLCGLGLNNNVRNLPWFNQLSQRNVSQELVNLQLSISKPRTLCRLRSPDLNVGPFIPPDPGKVPVRSGTPESYWMQDVTTMLLQDPLFQTVKPKASNCYTKDMLLVDDENVYALTPELRKEVLNLLQAERDRANDMQVDAMDVG